MLKGWVKNVHSLRIGKGMNGGYNAFSYTAPLASLVPWRVQTIIYTQVTTILSAPFSTLKNTQLPQLLRHLSLVSTAPTIKKKKENKERNT